MTEEERAIWVCEVFDDGDGGPHGWRPPTDEHEWQAVTGEAMSGELWRIRPLTEERVAGLPERADGFVAWRTPPSTDGVASRHHPGGGKGWEPFYLAETVTRLLAAERERGEDLAIHWRREFLGAIDRCMQLVQSWERMSQDGSVASELRTEWRVMARKLRVALGVNIPNGPPPRCGEIQPPPNLASLHERYGDELDNLRGLYDAMDAAELELDDWPELKRDLHSFTSQLAQIINRLTVPDQFSPAQQREGER